jgi:hypothetical protein
VQQVRVHLAPMPPLLQSIVRDLIGADATVELVGTGDPGDILGAARAAQADFLVIHERSAGKDACLRSLLDRRPFSIIAIDDEGATARLDISWRRLADACRLGLADALTSERASHDPRA